MVQVKQFANGITAILKPQTKNTPGVLRIFDKDKCLIAHREMFSGADILKNDSLSKVTVRFDKDTPEFMTEYIKHYRRFNETLRSVRKGCINIGNDFINRNKDGIIEYSREHWSKSASETILNRGVQQNFRLLKRPTHTGYASKMNELEELAHKMWKQFFGYTERKGGYLRETPKPMSFPAYKDFLG